MISKIQDSYIADAAGLLVLAVIMLIVSFFVSDSQMPGIAWPFIYSMEAVTALFVWHHHKAPKPPTKWLLLALYSVVAAALWFGLATLGARLTFVDEPTASKAFDLMVTVVIAPGLTVVAVIGWIRTLVLQLLSGLRSGHR